MRGLIGKKVGMTQIYGDAGNLIPVTVIEAGPCVVTQIKTTTKDGYNAIQVGFGERKEKHTSKQLQGHFQKAQVTPKQVVAEFEAVTGFEYKLGQAFGAALFKTGDVVKVSGITKGKGFAGVMKRHGFSGGPKTHGQKEYYRSPGSIGQASDPSRVFKGMRMAGHYGNKRDTKRNLVVVKVYPDKNFLLVRGSIPGPNNGIVYITK
ncbi:MAG: 50S ribosomal protein L3 [Fidelibacterota bacterium]